MKVKICHNDDIFLGPSDVQDAGIFQWLAKRFGGKPVTLEFDTYSDLGCNYYPCLIIREVKFIVPPGEILET